jgi:hypothetical protein
MPEGIPYASTNVVAGAGLELNYVGDHAYAYSGTVQAATGAVTLLEFTSGSSTFVGRINCAGAIPNNGAGVGSGCVSAFTLTMNGVEITRMKTETLQEDSPTFTEYPLMIPPYTSVKLIVLSNGTAGFVSAMIVGKVHQ